MSFKFKIVIVKFDRYDVVASFWTQIKILWLWDVLLLWKHIKLGVKKIHSKLKVAWTAHTSHGDFKFWFLVESPYNFFVHQSGWYSFNPLQKFWSESIPKSYWLFLFPNPSYPANKQTRWVRGWEHNLLGGGENPSYTYTMLSLHNLWTSRTRTNGS